METWIIFFGRLHPLLLHLPVGLLLGVLFLECIALSRRTRAYEAAIVALLGAGVLLSAITTLFGFFLSWEGGYDSAMLGWHKWTGVVVGVSALLAFVLKLVHRRRPVSCFMNGYRAMLGVTLIALVTAGHFGGSLTHGSTWLTEHLPVGRAQQVEARTADDEFTAVIQPIFARHCYECHGAEKQRGDLRLDSYDAVLGEGMSGLTTVVPGDLLSSYLSERILLPRDDVAAMPPPGKGALSGDEVLAIVHWITRGAPGPESAAQ